VGIAVDPIGSAAGGGGVASAEGFAYGKTASLKMTWREM
jgi:hypothetical protein